MAGSLSQCQPWQAGGKDNLKEYIFRGNFYFDTWAIIFLIILF